ncbi:MAG: lipopolysaccharide biosynthesis protein [Sphingobium sp.]|nr:lipopolysaccharide biosynthesis protein [Sphingobium sp.]
MTDGEGDGGSDRGGGFARILANTAWLLGGKGVGALLSIVYLAIVTRTLGVADFGRFALILSAAQAIKTLVSFESWQIIVRYGQDHLKAADAIAGGHALNRLARFCIMVDLASAIVGCALAAAVTLAFGPMMDLSRDMAINAILFCAAMLLTIRSTPMGLLRLFDRFDAGALAETMVPIGRMIGALLILATGPSIGGFLLAWAGAELLCAVSYWWLALRAGRGRMGSWRAGRTLDARGENAGLIGFLTATNLQATLSSLGQQVAVLFIGIFVGPTGAGLYRLANQLSQSLTKISGLLSRSIFVELARTRSQDGTDELRHLFRRTNRLALIAGGVIILLILLIGRPLLGLIAGPDFLPAYPVLLVLGVAASIELVGVSYRPLLMATDGARLSLWITLGATLLMFALMAALLPLYGTIGAAFASLASSAMMFAMMGWASRRLLRR